MATGSTVPNAVQAGYFGSQAQATYSWFHPSAPTQGTTTANGVVTSPVPSRGGGSVGSTSHTTTAQGAALITGKPVATLESIAESKPVAATPKPTPTVINLKPTSAPTPETRPLGPGEKPTFTLVKQEPTMAEKYPITTWASKTFPDLGGGVGPEVGRQLILTPFTLADVGVNLVTRPGLGIAEASDVFIGGTMGYIQAVGKTAFPFTLKPEGNVFKLAYSPPSTTEAATAISGTLLLAVGPKVGKVVGDLGSATAGKVVGFVGREIPGTGRIGPIVETTSRFGRETLPRVKTNVETFIVRGLEEVSGAGEGNLFPRMYKVSIPEEIKVTQTTGKYPSGTEFTLSTPTVSKSYNYLTTAPPIFAEGRASTSVPYRAGSTYVGGSEIAGQRFAQEGTGVLSFAPSPGGSSLIQPGTSYLSIGNMPAQGSGIWLFGDLFLKPEKTVPEASFSAFNIGGETKYYFKQNPAFTYELYREGTKSPVVTLPKTTVSYFDIDVRKLTGRMPRIVSITEAPKPLVSGPESSILFQGAKPKTPLIFAPEKPARNIPSEIKPVSPGLSRGLTQPQAIQIYRPKTIKEYAPKTLPKYLEPYTQIEAIGFQPGERPRVVMLGGLNVLSRVSNNWVNLVRVSPALRQSTTQLLPPSENQRNLIENPSIVVPKITQPPGPVITIVPKTRIVENFWEIPRQKTVIEALPITEAPPLIKIPRPFAMAGLGGGGNGEYFGSRAFIGRLPKTIRKKTVSTPWADLFSKTVTEARIGRAARSPSVKTSRKFAAGAGGLRIPTFEMLGRGGRRRR